MYERPAPRPAKIKCLKCNKEFDSIDVCTNRICPNCTRSNMKEYIPRCSSSNVYSGDSSGIPIED